MSTYYFLPTRNVFGMGASQEAGELMRSLGGRKTMIVTDRFLHESGMAGQIQAILAQAGVPQTKIYIPKYIADPYGAPLEDYRACRDKLVQQLEVFYESYVTRLLVFDNTMPPPPPFPEGSRPRP